MDATIVGGADIPFSTNTVLSGVGHTPGGTTFTLLTAGNYEINYNASFIAGIDAAIALTVNGTVNPATQVSALVTTDQLTGSIVRSLGTGNIITLRNNSLIALTLALALNVSSQIVFLRLNN